MYSPLLLIYGFLAAGAALLLEVVFGGFIHPETTFSLIGAVFIVIAAFVEEGSKWIFFRQFHHHYHEHLTKSNPFTFGLLFGTGYAILEILLIWLGFKPSSLAFLPIIGILALHLLTSLFFAYYLFRLAKRVLHHTLSLLLGMTILHAAYNLFLV